MSLSNDAPVYPTPMPGTYVVFSIDPAQTLESLRDPIVDAATKNMATKQYVACIEEGMNEFDLDAPYLGFFIRLVHRGVPARSEADGIEPDMCVPIWPNADHPLGRPPIMASRPLPWDDCYYHTLTPLTRFRVRTEFTRMTDAARAKASQRMKVSRFDCEDLARQAALREAYVKAHPQLVPAMPTTIDQGCASTEGSAESPGFSDAASHLSSDHYGEEEMSQDVGEDDPSSIENIMDMIFDEIRANRPSDTMALVRVSYDLSTLDTWADPEDFFKEEAYLKQLERESKARAIERARRIDEEAFPSVPRGFEKAKAKSSSLNLPATATQAWRRVRDFLTSFKSRVRSHKALSSSV